MRKTENRKQKTVKELQSVNCELYPVYFRAFTLIEAMIAVTIVTLAVAGPLVAARTAISATMVARDQLVASYLAQEGIEYVRAVRDDAFLAAYQAGGTTISSVAWSNFASAITQCHEPNICTFDPVQGAALPLASCPGNNCTAPLYRLANGIYTQQNLTGAQATPFIRTVQIKNVPNTDKEKQIVSKVEWNFHSSQYAVTVSDRLTPWQ